MTTPTNGAPTGLRRVIALLLVWVDVEQGIQAVVLLGLLWAATRPAVRAHFARPVTAGAERAG